jgi:hypothetical protein
MKTPIKAVANVGSLKSKKEISNKNGFKSLIC